MVALPFEPPPAQSRPAKEVRSGSLGLLNWRLLLALGANLFFWWSVLQVARWLF
jgi:hypothetical protein